MKLSRPFTEIKASYDVIVIGSGYGGSIAAARFASSGMRVCLLERGKEFLSGKFPDTIESSAKEMQINSDFFEARTNGLYDFHFSENISVFKGCGLGGTSLVNANVSIRPEDRVFTDVTWPSEIREDLTSLNDGFERARNMLRPTKYPEGKHGYPVLPKTEAMREIAGALDEPFQLAEINVNFETGTNHVGVFQNKCNNCGDCVTGCNSDAKNTLLMNYLPYAVGYGAEIYCNIDVSHISKSGDKWLVYYEVFDSFREKFKAPLLFCQSAIVIVSGGALGSTEILLRSGQNGLPLSAQLGQRFTGNGDVLGFAYNCEKPISGIGTGKFLKQNKEAVGGVGPCITSIVDMRHQEQLEKGITLEEGSVPGAIADMINISMLSLENQIGIDTDGGFSDWLRESAAEVVSLIEGPYAGATNKMQTFLIMSHDDGKGQLFLKNNKLDIKWPGVGSQPVFELANEKMLEATRVLGGTFIRSSIWNERMKHGLVTVHPLGGCCMSESGSSGVTNHIGNVFSGNTNDEVHPGLYVLDGAIIPRPVGTNPLLTISALTERACKIIIEKTGRTLMYDSPTPIIKEEQKLPAVQFTETMRGYFSLVEKSGFDEAFLKGKEAGSPMLFTLTIQTGDIESFVSNPMHEGRMAGTVIAPALSSEPLTTSDGIFNLMIDKSTTSTDKLMQYQMVLNSHNGEQFYFVGYKLMHNDPGLDVWNDTTKLFVTLYKGMAPGGDLIGKGILQIVPSDLVTQIATVRALNATTPYQSLEAITIFSQFFGQNILQTYCQSIL
ncbi:GMC family oxidoreductase N-terminal domain-containing protein [Dyadobacter sandarakinus]|uniref:Cholesterol oxidase n=1 Tax=Dyadobacter sandarakinus TaxID=2747268 RepID=A0ABX7I8I6_9BACT|nr:GMC family oxidoreductase N-terminal domain-containing protein [Dyadobacter sandarakinus]QRR01488.1 GMC family oxidoreductase [Dyadobacter sandarakinus]